ncbi:MAG: response regulator transcription factor, partial [Clostridia bacterium]|nr:response regulator transcription factor [Clostridia bacterium]
MRLLLVEDEVALSDALVFLLEKNGYQVDAAYDGETGEDSALSGIYDGIILDRMLPGREGLQILKTIREERISTPVMFLTAKDTINDRVDGLEAGADDYLIKPFSNKEFLARVKALTRRCEKEFLAEELAISGLKLYIDTCTCQIGGQSITLTKTESQLLELLIRNKNQILQKEQILDRIWGFNKDVEIAN